MCRYDQPRVWACTIPSVLLELLLQQEGSSPHATPPAGPLWPCHPPNLCPIINDGQVGQASTVPKGLLWLAGRTLYFLETCSVLCSDPYRSPLASHHVRGLVSRSDRTEFARHLPQPWLCVVELPGDNSAVYFHICVTSEALGGPSDPGGQPENPNNVPTSVLQWRMGR